MGLDVGTRNGLLSVRTVHTYLHTGAVVLATKIRLENGNDHKMEKKKAMLGCGSFVRGRKRKRVDSRPLLYYRENIRREGSWDFSIHQYNLPSIPIINIPNPFST